MQEGYWELTTELGDLIDVNVDLFANVFLKSKGICSLGEISQSQFQAFRVEICVGSSFLSNLNIFLDSKIEIIPDRHHTITSQM